MKVRRDEDGKACLFPVRWNADLSALVPPPVSHILPIDEIYDTSGGDAELMREVVLGMPRPIAVSAILANMSGTYLPRYGGVAGIMFDDGSVLSWGPPETQPAP